MAAVEALFHKGYRTVATDEKSNSKVRKKKKRSKFSVNPEGVMADLSRGSEGDPPGHVSYLGEDVESIPPDFIKKYGSVARRLDLSYNRLKHLEGLSEFKVLEELILDNNDLSDGALECLPSLPRIHTLSLNKNKIDNCDQLLEEVKKKCPSLRYLSLLGNTACPNPLLGYGHDEDDYRRYRLYVLYRLPNLKFLDSSIVSEDERKEAKRVGQFMKVVKPSENQQGDENDDELTLSDVPHYTPLPNRDPSQKGKGM
jgi:hypothetical protein